MKRLYKISFPRTKAIVDENIRETLYFISKEEIFSKRNVYLFLKENDIYFLPRDSLKYYGWHYFNQFVRLEKLAEEDTTIGRVAAWWCFFVEYCPKYKVKREREMIRSLEEEFKFIEDTKFRLILKWKKDK
jgi:hypothetical protein